jgi:hypothetical protein
MRDALKKKFGVRTISTVLNLRALSKDDGAPAKEFLGYIKSGLKCSCSQKLTSPKSITCWPCDFMASGRYSLEPLV